MAFEKLEYETIVIKAVNDLKKKHFGGTDIVFHFNEMKKSEGFFKAFVDPVIRDAFWKEYVDTIDQLPMEILGVYFDSKKMSRLFHESKYNNYEIGFTMLLDSFMHYLVEKE